MEELFDPQKHHFAAWISIHDVAQEDGFPSFGRSAQLPSPGEAELCYAASCGFTGVADYLITIWAQDVNAHYSWLTPLHAASGHGHAEVVHLLLRYDADVNIRDRSGGRWTPLLFASSLAHANVVQLLLEHGADVNAQTTANNTPLWIASFHGHVEVARLLLEHGADVHTQGHDNRTPYQVAIKYGHAEVAQLLLEHGAERD
jgi:hypothetical protein